MFFFSRNKLSRFNISLYRYFNKFFSSAHSLMSRDDSLILDNQEKEMDAEKGKEKDNEEQIDLDDNTSQANNIPSSVSFFKYAHKRWKPVTVSFSYRDLLSRNVLDLIKNKIEQGYCYICIIGVSYGVDDKYRMVGCNFAFKFDDKDNTNNLNHLYDHIYQSIDFFLTTKPSGQEIVEGDINYFEIRFRRVDSKFLTDLRIDSAFLSEQDKNRDIFKKQINYFPLTIDIEALGKPISNITINNGTVTSLIVKIKDRIIDVMEYIDFENKYRIINKKQPILFDQSYTFFLREGGTTKYILAVKQLDNNRFLKEAYTLRGKWLGSVIDKIESNKLVSRNIGDK